MPNDLYAAYNSLSVAQKKDAYNYIMMLSLKNKRKLKKTKARTAEEINFVLDKIGCDELILGDASIESLREVLKDDVW